MEQTLVSADGTVVAGVTGGASYHVLLAHVGSNVTIVVPAVAGDTKEAVKSVIGLSESDTAVLLIRNVFQSQGIGNDYVYNASAVATAGATLGPGSTNPPTLVFTDSGYVATKTWFRYSGTTYLPAAPSDVVVWDGSFGGGSSVLALKAVTEDFESYGVNPVYDRGQKIPSPPTLQQKTYFISLALQSLIQTFPDQFVPSSIPDRLSLIASNKSLTTFQVGMRQAGSISEPLFRSVVIETLEYMASIIRDVFGNSTDYELILSDVDLSLHDRLTSQVLVRGKVQKDTITDDKFRDQTLRIFKRIIEVFSACLS